MVTLKDILDQVPSVERSALFYALEHDLTHYYVFEDGTYIGVNTSYVKNLKSELNSGQWSAGKRIDGSIKSISDIGITDRHRN